MKCGTIFFLSIFFGSLTLLGGGCDDQRSVELSENGQALSSRKVVARSSGERLEFVPGELLVTFRKGLAKGEGRKAMAGVGFAAQRSLRFDRAPASRINRTELLSLPSGMDVQQAIDSLLRNPVVEAAQPNYLYYPCEVPDDTYFDLQWAHENLGGNAPFDGISGLRGPDPRMQGVDMATLEANDEIAARGLSMSPVIVAVIDTGVDYTHEDLAGNMWPLIGYDFAAVDDDPMDEDSHGTHVAGAIAAIRNSVGVYGTAPNVQIMALRFIGASGSGTTADAIAAINYAVSNGAQILNNSWGGGGSEPLLEAAISAARDQGVLFVAAAGNDGTSNDVTPHYPSNYLVDNVISVGGSTAWGDRGGFSNYGFGTVHLFAPGEEILSTTPSLLTGYPDDDYQICSWDTGWGAWIQWSGTSMAAPHVSGAAALLYGLGPDLFPTWAVMTPVERMSAIRSRMFDRAERWASL
ncbi:MAG: S8 family serine peptidase, partial [Deltaproteobacteria bacterium]|nr:S8 family serine peptidase [Deltaproteobacteria bacterium]